MVYPIYWYYFINLLGDSKIYLHISEKSVNNKKKIYSHISEKSYKLYGDSRIRIKFTHVLVRNLIDNMKNLLIY